MIDLRVCTEAMAGETQKSVARLRADVVAYQARLDDAERLALAGQDPLTGLDNRWRVGSSIEYRLGLKQAFAVLFLDTIGRFGGDEFIAVLNAGAQDVDSHIERLARWVFGDYTMRVGDTSRKVAVSAAIGAAAWQAGDSLRTFPDHADAAMYRDKRARKLSYLNR